MISKFLSYIEIKTKITSTFAFLLALAYLVYIDQPIDYLATTIFFASMFLFDLTTTSINNYIDTKTNHQTLQFKRKIALMIIIILLALSIFLGLYLVYLTDIVILLIGGLCFLTGILYTYGPVPISRLPLGEVISGLFYGFFIPFIMLYINMPKGTFLTLDYNITDIVINLKLNLIPIGKLILLSVAPVFATANIMLANNICDLEKDIAVNRYTLPFFIKKDNAILLFAWIYYAIYITDIILVATKILHPIFLLSLLTIIIVQKNINVFNKVQKKETTFEVAIVNFIIIMSSRVLLIFVSSLF